MDSLIYSHYLLGTEEEFNKELELMSYCSFALEDFVCSDAYFDNDYRYFTYEEMIEASDWDKGDLDN